MKRWRFRFSRMLTDETDVRAVQGYLDRYRDTQARHASDMADLEELHQEVLQALTRKHKAVRGLTYIIDPTHIAEHGVMFLTSKETEEYDDGKPDPQETLQ